MMHMVMHSQMPRDLQEGNCEVTGNGKKRKRPRKAAGQAKGRGKDASQAFGGGTVSFMSAAALMSKQ